MIRATFKTKDDVKLKHSKWDTDVLRVPFGVNVKGMSRDEIEGLMDRFIQMGAKGFGQQEIDTDFKMQIMDEYLKESEAKYGSDKDVFLSVKFHQDKSLRLVGSLSKPAFEGGTIYDKDTLIELIDNINCDMPLTLEKSDRFQKQEASNESGLSY